MAGTEGPAESKAPLDFFNYDRVALGELLEEKCGFPKYRAAQLFDWVYRQGISDCLLMTNIAKEWRQYLAANFAFRKAVVINKVQSVDGTQKYLLEVSPGRAVECVLIPQQGRTTLCLSSQVGCAMGCRFCRTATLGFKENLSTGDIVRELLAVQEDVGPAASPAFDNVVFMGMGEPLHNYEAVVSAIKILLDDHAFHIGQRKITVSSAGLLPALERFVKEGLDVSLALSLNAATDSVRSELMPINKRYNISQLLEFIRHCPLKPRRKITLEYVLFSGINDTNEQLKELLLLLGGLRVKVNLIPYNENAGLPFKTTSAETIDHWYRTLNKAGVQTTIRLSKGSDISAACGQLAAKQAQKH